MELVKEFYKKYKKYILILIAIVCVLNLVFIITDLFAGKKFKVGLLLYSPINNENWLSFFGNFAGGFASFLLFTSSQEALKQEKDNIKYQNEVIKIENQKKIITEYLSTFEINEVYNLLSLFQNSSFLNTVNNDEKIIADYLSKRAKIIRSLNLEQLKLDFITDLRLIIDETSEEKNRIERYHNLVDLRELYNIALDEVHSKIQEFIKIDDSTKRKEKFNLLFNSKCKREEEYKKRALNILKKYEDFLTTKLKKSLNEELEELWFTNIFNIYLEYVVNSLTEYFYNIELNLNNKY